MTDAERSTGTDAEDAAIRAAVWQAVTRAAGVAAVEIERTSDQVRVYIHAARPDIVTGDRAADADRLRGELQQLTSKRLELDVLRVPTPGTTALLSPKTARGG